VFSRKLLVIARHEFIYTVTRIGYLVTLLGMPIFIGAIGGISGFAAYRSEMEKRTEKKVIGLVDDTGLFAHAELSVPMEEAPEGMELQQLRKLQKSPQRAQLPVELRRFGSLDEAKAALSAEQIASVLHVPRDYVKSGAVEEIVRPEKGFSPGGHTGRLRAWLVRSLLAGQVPPDLVERAARPLWNVETLVLEPDGKLAPEDMLRALRPLIVPMGFAMLLMLSVFTSASFLATGLSEEKQNRALEMLLTSITPEQLFWGKLLGIGAAALLQFLIYLALVAVPAAAMFAQLDLRFGQAAAALVYFILGFFFFGSVLLAVGAIGNTQKYTQQLSGLFTFTAVVPMMMLQPILSAPSSGLARVLTYIPFTAPITGMLRAGAGALPWWEMLLSYASLALGCWLAVKACSKIFRVALLATGTVPSLKQIWSWVRA
jgi:ABC-2 type transport system permease protein